MSAPETCPRCGADDPRLPGMVGTVVCDSTWHLRIVQAPGAHLGGTGWLRIAIGAVLGILVGAGLSRTVGPLPTWVFWLLLAALYASVAWRSGWGRRWRERARERLRGERE